AVQSADGTLTAVTIHIAGTNDAAVLSADTKSLTETNLAADISTAGTLTISDVRNRTRFNSKASTTATHTTFPIASAGPWTTTATPAHNDTPALPASLPIFAVQSADGTLTAVTIHIAGTNDAAVLSADTKSLTETNLAADISTAGTLTIS